MSILAEAQHLDWPAEILGKSACMIVVVDSITQKEAIELGHVKIKKLLAEARARPSTSGATIKTSSRIAAPCESCLTQRRWPAKMPVALGQKRPYICES